MAARNSRHGRQYEEDETMFRPVRKKANEISVEEAKKLLTQSSLPINTVSLYVGYSNFSYFTKMFKDNTGYAPLEYRRNFGER